MIRLSFDVEGQKLLIGLGSDSKKTYFKQILYGLILFQPGKYVACIYDQQWHIGIIIERCEEENDVYVKFMKQSLSDVLSWPQNTNDKCCIPFQDILCIIDAPEPQGHSGRNYKIASSAKDLILSIITNE